MSESYAGFDASGFPGLPVMAWLRQRTNLRWCGFYLGKAPSHPDPGWMPHRAELVRQGWGLAPIYLGQQTTGPGSHVVTGPQGKLDGANAAALMRQAGFPPGSFCFLDLENGPPFGQPQHDYVAAWIDATSAEGFGPGVYCSFLMAAQVAALRPAARIWVFHVPTTALHKVAGSAFPAPSPAGSGYAGASMWQRDMACQISASGGLLLVDLDVSVSPDPSAPARPAASVPKTPAVPQVPQQAKETTTMTTTAPATTPAAPTTPVAASTPNSLIATLETLRKSTDAKAVQLADSAMPWFVHMIITDKMITDGIDYGFATVEGAAKNLLPTVETVEKLVTQAVQWTNAHWPSFLPTSIRDNVEDFVVIRLQSLGWLPAEFGRVAASMQAKAA